MCVCVCVCPGSRQAECERGPVEGRVGPILTAPLCLHFHTLLSHYKRRGSNRTDTKDAGFRGGERTDRKSVMSEGKEGGKAGERYMNEMSNRCSEGNQCFALCPLPLYITALLSQII